MTYCFRQHSEELMNTLLSHETTGEESWMLGKQCNWCQSHKMDGVRQDCTDTTQIYTIFNSCKVSSSTYTATVSIHPSIFTSIHPIYVRKAYKPWNSKAIIFFLFFFLSSPFLMLYFSFPTFPFLVKNNKFFLKDQSKSVNSAAIFATIPDSNFGHARPTPIYLNGQILKSQLLPKLMFN